MACTVHSCRGSLCCRFYYPQGRPILAQHLDLVLKKVAAAFDNFPNQQVPRHQFGVIAKVSYGLLEPRNSWHIA